MGLVGICNLKLGSLFPQEFVVRLFLPSRKDPVHLDFRRRTSNSGQRNFVQLDHSLVEFGRNAAFVKIMWKFIFGNDEFKFLGSEKKPCTIVSSHIIESNPGRFKHKTPLLGFVDQRINFYQFSTSLKTKMVNFHLTSCINFHFRHFSYSQFW